MPDEIYTKLMNKLDKSSELYSFLASDQGARLLKTYCSQKRASQLKEDGSQYRLIDMLVVGSLLLDNKILKSDAPNFLKGVLSITKDGLCDYSAWQAFESRYYSFYVMWKEEI